MTASRSTPPPTSRPNPLETLRDRVERARERTTYGAHLAPFPEPLTSDEIDDPVDVLERYLERATVPRALQEPLDRRTAPEPLRSLYATLEAGHDLSRSGPGDESPPDLPSEGGPLQQLEAVFDRELETLGGRSAVDLSPRTDETTRDDSTRDEPSASPEEATQTPEIERVGRHVLETLADEPLPGDVRVEVIRRLSAHLEAPDPDGLQEIFRLLLK